ncbi:MAG TPA: hypothetical protein VNP04_27225 [Alphaproteobacteria bacterium]|nr:hypothetical protein [Alphaproteobacteria bacterium]
MGTERVVAFLQASMKVLFVCTQNAARSPMAAAIFRELVGGRSRHLVRSAGIASSAPQRLTTSRLSSTPALPRQRD